MENLPSVGSRKMENETPLLLISGVRLMVHNYWLDLNERYSYRQLFFIFFSFWFTVLLVLSLGFIAFAPFYYFFYQIL